MASIQLKTSPVKFALLALRVQIPQVKEDASTPAPKSAKVQAESAQPSPWVEEDAPLEPKFPTDWIRNDVKFNADVDTMEQREKSIQERVKKQQAWKATCTSISHCVPVQIPRFC